MGNYPPFRTLDISFSNQCPLRCKHCMFAADMQYAGPRISAAVAKRIVDEAAEMETFNLLAAGSQEVFLDYEVFLEVVNYAHKQYSARLTISTSCYWVKDKEHARAMFSELQEHGLFTVLISLDRYHLEFVRFEKIVAALAALRELKIATTVQTIRGRDDPGCEDYRMALGEVAEGDWIEFCELPAVPVGRGASEPEERLALVQGMPGGDCNVFDVLHIEPDGAVKPCCGAGLTATGLTMGNIHEQKLVQIAEHMQIDPLLNSLRAWRGPAHLYRVLAELGLNGFQKPAYAGTCHACYDLFSRSDVVAELRRYLADQAVGILAARWYAEQARDLA